MTTHALIQYLEMFKDFNNGNTLENIVLQHGKFYNPPTFAPRPKHIVKGRDKHCFDNSYHIAIQNKGYTYVEGIAVSLIPLHHAWVLDENGIVIETTWQDAGSGYYGIAFDFKFIHQVFLDTKTYGVIDLTSPTFRKRFEIK